MYPYSTCRSRSAHSGLVKKKSAHQERSLLAIRRQTTEAFPRTEGFPGPPPAPLRQRNGEESTTKSLVSFDGQDPSASKAKGLDLQRRKQLDRELLYLQDPLKLAENTVDLLRRDDHQKALEIVRMASKRTSCVVSWNHIVDYEMSRGRLQKAEKIYNEMKKRAQKPDAQTYTILLRGFSWHRHPQDSLPRALKIYHSMFAENCPVKPNIIHTNAVLKVCALARDLDALWGVAAKLPTKGSGAPNNFTFTTILNAIRNVAWNKDTDLKDEDWEQKSLRRQRAVMQGRRLWEDIIPRWRAGDMWIDEELVCAMGRLLLLGSTERDYDDVLSLVEQVMAIPRQKRKSPELEQLADAGELPPPAPEPTKSALQENPDDDLIPLDEEKDSLPTAEDTMGPRSPSPSPSTELTNVFLPQTPNPKLSIPRPGRNTLSLLLDACINLRAVSSAQAYWGLLTSPTGPYNIHPDSDNYHMYLRLLRVQRASRVAAELIQDMHSGELKDMKILQPKTFRIALSCCVRDKNSPNSMSHAQQILEIMYKSLTQPDVKALEMYMQLASSHAKRDYRITLSALRALEPGMKLLKNATNFGYGDVTVEQKQEVLELAKKVLGGLDSVLWHAGDRVQGQEKGWVERMRGWLSAWMLRRRRVAEKGRKRKGEERVGGLDSVPGLEETDDGTMVVSGWQRDRRTDVGTKEDGNDAKIFSGRRRFMLTRRPRRPERTLEGGLRKRMQRARRERERSGEFEF
ncbi:MAG: hypothetical protein Q9201_005924 [Fulgogasparrea decipioides]